MPARSPAIRQVNAPERASARWSGRMPSTPGWYPAHETAEPARQVAAGARPPRRPGERPLAQLTPAG
jgi:hypothetical protein